jgi:hypothetical protein
MKLILVAASALLACALSFPSLCAGQTGASARVSGQVVDQTGAVLPKAQIDLEDISTRIHRATESDSSGYFSFDVLPPSNYRLTATVPGFDKAVISPIAALVGQTTNVSVPMKPGVLTQEISVESSTTALQTESSSLGSVVTQTTATAMPLLLRDPTQLVTLVAGVTADHRSEGATAPGSNLGGLSYQGRLAFEINGGWRSQAVTMVDGVDVTISAGSFLSTPIQPTSDITQEFKVQTLNIPAAFGRGAGVLNIVTRSGTNAVHGSAFEFLQNNDLDANNFFSNKAGQHLPHLERNQFGFAVGGPIWKDKTFFFVDSEWLKQANLDPITTQVPTAAQESGNFAGLYSTNGTPITIYNPYTTMLNASGQRVRVPFANNQIPSSLITPFAAQLFHYYPAPNNLGVLGPNGVYTGVGNYAIDGTQRSNYDRTDVKIDENLGERHHIMARYSRDYYIINSVDVYNNIASPTSLSTRNNDQPGDNAVLSWTWTATPSLVLVQSLNWSRIVDDSNSKSLGFDVSQLDGPYANGAIQNYAKTYAGGTTFPNISLTGYAPLGDGFGQNFTEPYSNYQYSIGVLKTLGKHTISAGFQGILLQASDTTYKGFGGTFGFSGGFTCGPNPLTCSTNTGNPVADLLLNTVDSGSMNAAFSTFNSGKYLAGYIQDDFRVTPKLTLNLGLRYEVNTPFTERYNREYQLNTTIANPVGSQSGVNTGGANLNSYFQTLAGHPVNGGVVFPNSVGASGAGIVSTDWTNWSPRLGVAYQISNKLVFRGGYSKLYLLSPEAPGPPSSANGPFGATTSIISSLNGIDPNVTLNNPYPNGFYTPLGSSQGLATFLGTSFNTGADQGKTPYQHQWSVGFEYQLGKDSVIGVSYVGTSSRRLTCPFFSCVNAVPQSLVAKYGSAVVQTVANPFYGIITNPLAALSASTVQLGQLLKQFPQYSGATMQLPAYQGPSVNTFYSNYNALEVQANKRYSHGLTLSAAFTWSKNLTNADAADSGYLGPQAGYQNQYDFKGEYSLSASDVPYRLAVGYVYDLPFGKKKAIGSSWPAAVDALLGGWQVAGNTTFAGGYPLPISETGVTTGGFGGTSRPNTAGNACLDNGMGRSRNDKINQWLSPSGFALNPNFTFGDAPRETSCRGDGIKNTDLSAIKFFNLTERFKLEFRSEFFNIFNRTRLGAPNTTFGGSTFGVITNTLNVPRVIQFGLKLNF